MGLHKPLCGHKERAGAVPHATDVQGFVHLICGGAAPNASITCLDFRGLSRKVQLSRRSVGSRKDQVKILIVMVL